MRARLPQQAIPTSRVALRTPSAVIAATRCGSRAFMVRDNGHRPRAMAVPHHEDNHRIPRMGLPATIYNPHDVPKRSEKRSFARCVNLTAACGERLLQAIARLAVEIYFSVVSGTKWRVGTGFGATASFSTLKTRWSSGEEDTKSA